MRLLIAAMALSVIGWAAGPKRIVLVSGDEEYRSEEALPQLARMLERHGGFKCTVLYAIDPKDGTINPNVNSNIPGLEALGTADLMIIATRFRDLPDEQMRHIVEYVERGKPVVGLRTATHAFNLKTSATYKHWSWNSKEWDGGFGRQVLGETWINHHGKHAFQSTRGIVAAAQAGHPVLRGIKDGTIWGPTDVYTTRIPFPAENTVLVYGQVVEGMKESDPAAVGAKNDPMMAVAWVREYKGARVFTTTMGSSTDLLNEPFRRLVMNGVYWALGLEGRIKAGMSVGLVGEFKPSPFKFNGHIAGRKPGEF